MLLESAVFGNLHAAFGGGPTEKSCSRQKLAGGLPYFCLGFIGPKAEAEEIKAHLRAFLGDTLHLELSEEKTLITHATTEAAHFLGYELVVQHANDRRDRTGRRCVNGKVALRVPAQVLRTRCSCYTRHGKPWHRPELLHESDFGIMGRYQAEYRGIVQYYQLAQNVSWFWELYRVMRLSLLKTLANRRKSTVGRMVRKYRASVTTPAGRLNCLEVMVARGEKPPLVARFGGLPLRHQRAAILVDRPTTIVRSPRAQRVDPATLGGPL
jgi:Type II intron maturase